MPSRCTRGLSCVLIRSAPEADQDCKGFSKSTEASAGSPCGPCCPWALRSAQRRWHGRLLRRDGTETSGRVWSTSDLNAKRQLVFRSILGSA